MKTHLKRIISLTVALIMLVACVPAQLLAADVYSINTGKLLIDGEVVEFKNQPFITDKAFYIPLEESAQYLGFEIEGNDYENGVYISRGGESLWLQAGNLVAKYNSEGVELDSIPTYVEDVFYVPVTMLREPFGFVVDVDMVNATASLTECSTVKITEGNAAVISLTSVGVHGSTEYYGDRNNINLSEDGNDVLNNKSDIASKLLYKADLSAYADKKITKLTLRFYSSQNSSGVPTFSVYHVKEDWDALSVSKDKAPTYDAEPVAVQVCSAEDPVNPWNKSGYNYVEIDITNAARYITEQQPYANVMLATSIYSNNQGNLVRGVNTDKAPEFYIETKVDGNYTTKAYTGEVVKRESKLEFDEFDLLTALGIFRNDDTFSANRNQSVSRAEFVDYAVRLLNDDTSVDCANPYSDINPDNLHYPGIMKALLLGYISSDDTFRPDEPITIAEASKLLCGILGNEGAAADRGGWPYGYISVLITTKVFEGVDGVGPEDTISYGEMYRILYNALKAEHLVGKIYSENLTVFSAMDAKKTLLYTNFKCYTVEGVVTGNGYTSITGKGTNRGILQLDGENYLVNTDKYDSALGMSVSGIYKENDDNDKTILYVGVLSNRNNSFVVNADNIDNVVSDGSGYVFKYVTEKGKTKKIEITSDMLIINNEGYLPYSKADSNTFYPGIGKVEFMDNDSDGEYEIIYITSYNDVFVSAVDSAAGIIYDKYGRKSVDLKLKNDLYTYSIKDNKGNTYQASDIQENDVLSVLMGSNIKNTQIILSRKTLVGEVTEAETLGNGRVRAVIGGDSATTIPGDTSINVYLGLSGTFYLDAFGNLAGVSMDTAGKELGYLVALGYKSEAFEDILQLQIFTQGTDAEDGIPVFNCDEKIKFNGYKGYLPTQVYEKLTSNGEVVRQPIIFGRNIKGEIDYINIAESAYASDIPIEEKLIKKYDYQVDGDGKEVTDHGKLRYKEPILGGFYAVNNNVFLFSVPDDGSALEDYIELTDTGPSELIPVDVYAIGEDSISVDMLVFEGFQNSSSPASSDFFAVVTNRTIAIRNEQTVELLKVIKHGKNIEIIVDKDKLDADTLSELEGLDCGDVIRYSLDLKGRLTSLVKYYDYRTKTITLVGKAGYPGANKVAMASTVDIFGGPVKRKEDGFLLIGCVEDPTAKDRILYGEGAESVMYCYDVYDRNVVSRKATYSEILDEESANDNRDGILCHVTYGNIIKSVMLVDLQGDFSDAVGENAVPVEFTDPSGSVATVEKSWYRGADGTIPEIAEFDKSAENKTLVWVCVNDGKSYRSGDSFTVPDTDKVTFEAQWLELPKVSFKNDETVGTDGSTPDVFATADSNIVTLPANGFSAQDGYEFVKWVDANGREYAEGDSYLITSDADVLTAKWEYTGRFKIEFVPGEAQYKGTGVATQYGVMGDAITLPVIPETDINDGYEFKCWTDGTDTYDSGATYIMPEHSVSITALWYTKVTVANDGAAQINQETPDDEVAVDAEYVVDDHYSGTKNDRELMLKFDISDFASMTEIKSVMLEMVVSGANTPANRGLAVYSTDYVWPDSVLTWNAFKNSGSSIAEIGSWYYNSRPDGWEIGDTVSIDISSYIQAALDEGKTSIVLCVIRGGGGTSGDRYYKISAAAEEAPRLVVTYSE